jgi:Uma2 family endonuclease
MPLITHPDIEIDYPDQDGNPMADNTRQFRLIVMIKENLEILYASLLDVFVAGDLLWYPIEGDNKTRLAPDAMVVFGRPKGDRGSYQQWKEGNIAPQITFEILSPSNFAPEMEEKRVFYETHGVEEYYSYDPDRFRLKGWLRQNNQLLPIPEMNGWVSPRMGIRFSHVKGDLEIYRPDGRKFLTSVELEQEARQAQLAAIQQAQRAEQQFQRAQAAQQEAQAAQQEAQAAQQQVELIIVNLLRSGMSIEQIAAIAGVNVEQVEVFRENLS